MGENVIRLLTTMTFEGPRFDDHGLDVAVLSELSFYKTLVLQTAAELWLAAHPEQTNLPEGFEESFSVKIYAVNPGSVSVDLMRVQESPASEDFFDRAATLVEEAVTAMASTSTLPDAFPPRLIPLFCDFGTTLNEDERLSLWSAHRRTPARFTRSVRARFIDAAQKQSVHLKQP